MLLKNLCIYVLDKQKFVLCETKDVHSSSKTTIESLFKSVLFNLQKSRNKYEFVNENY